MNKSMLKTTFREIKHSFGRFISIMCIVALGVGFFAGLKTARPDMIKTATDYLDEHIMYDYKLMNSYGFDSDSVKNAKKEKDVRVAEGAYSLDAVMKLGDMESAFKIHSVTDNINILNLEYGRMPKNASECVADRRYFNKDKLGSKITLSDNNDEDTLKMLKNKEFTVVGIADSPIYLNYERGTTSLLNGSISAFVYLPKSAFDSEYYTEIYLRLNKNYEIYSDEYKNYINSVEKDIKNLSKSLADLRYDSIVKEATDKYNEGYDEYRKNLDKYNSQKSSTEKKLNDAFQQITDSQNTLSKKQKEYEDGLEQYRRNKAAFDSGKAEFNDGYSKVTSAIAEAESGINQLQNVLMQYESAPLTEEIAQKTAAVKAQLEAAQKTKSELEIKKSVLDEKRNELEEQQKALENAKAQLDSAQIQLNDGINKLESAKSEYYSSKEKADSELEKAAKKLDDAKITLDDAKKDIAKIEKPDSFTLGRDTNTGYVCFENDSGIVDGLAEVFPLFFFLVAALMCMTTMTRMVEEQRTDIGVMKALGYSKAAVMSKYVSYSALSGVLGTLLGFFGGSFLFPKAIWTAYKIMYGFAPLKIIYNPIIAVGLLIVSLVCTVGATVLSCRSELNLNAAQLMRPKVLKSGKHGFFERFKAFQRLKFLRKVSVRNLTRYKRRFFMMVIGIAGCTALLITGFGINDSIRKICDYQYGEIMNYDYEIMFASPRSQNERTDFARNSEYAGSTIFVHNLSYDITTQKGVKSAKVIAPSSSGIDKFIDLHSSKTKIAYPKKNCAVVSSKFAETNSISVGGKITVTDANMKTAELTVSGICDNYVYNYVYTTLDTLSEQFGYAPDVKNAFIKCGDDISDVHSVGAKLSKEDGVLSVTVTKDVVERVSNMLESLNFIVMLIVACAGALAFVVIYNLTNINITERIREIATIKVLGFYPRETASYIFGENFVLTGLGALLGILLGRLLHAFVMSQINIEMVSFEVRVAPLSIILSIVLTFVFAVLVDFFMYFKLKKIDMAQSLKSIE